MACSDITQGRAKQCKDSIGGTSKLFLLNYEEDAFTITAGEATAINPLVTAVYEYDLIGDTHPFSENGVGSIDNGTFVNTQTIVAQLPKQDAVTSAELNLVAKSFPIGVVKDRNGVYHLVGHTDGINFTIDSTTGSAKGDFNGYTLTGTSTENAFSPKLDSATITALLALVA